MLSTDRSHRITANASSPMHRGVHDARHDDSGPSEAVNIGLSPERQDLVSDRLDDCSSRRPGLAASPMAASWRAVTSTDVLPAESARNRSASHAWGPRPAGDPTLTAPREGWAAAFWSTAKAVWAVPYLALAATRPLLAFKWPALFASPSLPGVPHPDAPERRLASQADWRDREQQITLRSQGVLPTSPGRHLNLHQPGAYTNASWLAEDFQRLVLGSAFVGIYQHMGRIRALDRLGLIPKEIVGYSSGAITGAMVCCLSLEAAERAMLSLRVADFLDPSLSLAWSRGGACAGLRLQAKIERTLSPGGTDRIEGLTPAFQVAVYDRQERQTVLHARGPLALRVRQSASLPILFATERYIDGGWIDHHGRLAMPAGVRTLQSRVCAGNGGTLARAIGREGAIFSWSEDPEHATLSVRPQVQVHETNFVYMIDHDKPALQRIIDESERLTLAWLALPRAASAAAERGHTPTAWKRGCQAPAGL